jgi:anti-anti-sigma factor
MVFHPLSRSESPALRMEQERRCSWVRVNTHHLFAAEPRGLSMLTINVQNLGDVAVLRCQGRIVTGDENTILRNAVLLGKSGISTLVIDLAQVAGIDAGGLGELLGLRTWARSKGIQLKLMNVPASIQQMLEVTNLTRVFEICSEKDLEAHLNRAQSAI